MFFKQDTSNPFYVGLDKEGRPATIGYVYYNKTGHFYAQSDPNRATDDVLTDQSSEQRIVYTYT